MARARSFRATATLDGMETADAFCLCVPTPLNEYREPDLSFGVGTMESFLPYLRRGQIVSLESTTAMPPYTNWATAATNIQVAVNAAEVGDEIVVTNGVYRTGGRTVGTNLLVNRVAVDTPLMVRSVNGPFFR